MIATAIIIRAIPTAKFGENPSPKKNTLTATAVTGSRAPSIAAIVGPAYFME